MIAIDLGSERLDDSLREFAHRRAESEVLGREL
jgi:hypothetical protein